MIGRGLALLLLALLAPTPVFAHEAYVLSPEEFRQGMASSQTPLFSALADPKNLTLTLVITLGILTALVLAIIFWRSNLGRRVDTRLRAWQRLGPVLVRVAVGASFIIGALSQQFLGPEVSFASFGPADPLRIVMLVAGSMILFGLLTEAAALASLIVFSWAALAYGWYLTTYLNYLAEILVLLIFGARTFSLDRMLLGAKERWPALFEYESTIVRVGYGIALIYAAVLVKFFHPQLSLLVVSDYHLTQFNWLFPSDPNLLVLGAGMAEIALGLFILIGFQVRLTVLVTIFYLTLSLFYFRELVWPHLILYGISLKLLFDGGGRLALDNLLSRR
jgi:uncharacterized membrane protein YphA (DoxX/SURF4 family)